MDMINFFTMMPGDVKKQDVTIDFMFSTICRNRKSCYKYGNQKFGFGKTRCKYENRRGGFGKNSRKYTFVRGQNRKSCCKYGLSHTVPHYFFKRNNSFIKHTHSFADLGNSFIALGNSIVKYS
ncbi:MAG: hypothetical protein LBK58_15330 [Prevotellaceae bacterium]|nr:hypothetical protein [Prevotellaceae bacterium]